jgi:hypothetical protein
MSASTRMDVADHDSATANEPLIGGRATRRSLAKGATAFIAGLATLLYPSTASACATQPDQCCVLATCTLCRYQVSRFRFTCPSGYNRHVWSCINPDGRRVYCGECTGASSCWYGPFNCSIWYYS